MLRLVLRLTILLESRVQIRNNTKMSISKNEIPKRSRPTQSMYVWVMGQEKMMKINRSMKMNKLLAPKKWTSERQSLDLRVIIKSLFIIYIQGRKKGRNVKSRKKSRNASKRLMERMALHKMEQPLLPQMGFQEVHWMKMRPTQNLPLVQVRVKAKRMTLQMTSTRVRAPAFLKKNLMVSVLFLQDRIRLSVTITS